VLAAVALACVALCTPGCAVIDGLTNGGVFDGCENDGDCSYAQICTREGCKDDSDLGQGAYCSEDHDCNRWSSSDVGCLSELNAGQGECRCLSGNCAFALGTACESTDACSGLEFCHREDGLCYQLYDCVGHSDCTGVCTVSGCNNDLPGAFTMCQDCSADICAGYRCWSLGSPCLSNDECSSTFCSLPEGGRCLILN